MSIRSPRRIRQPARGSLHPQPESPHACCPRPPSRPVPGAALLRLILRIERFQEWVFEEVLPSIRRTGAYALPSAEPTPVNLLAALGDPDQVLALLAHHARATLAARAVAEAERLGRLAAEEDAAIANEDFLQASRALTVVTTKQEVTSAELARKTDRVEALQPKALAYDAMSASRGSDCVSDVAKDLRMLPTRLFERLDEMGWIMRRNRGGAMASDTRKGAWVGADLGLRKEYVEHANETVSTPIGLVTRRQVLITAKGKERLELLLAQGSLALRSSRG